MLSNNFISILEYSINNIKIILIIEKHFNMDNVIYKQNISIFINI